MIDVHTLEFRTILKRTTVACNCRMRRSHRMQSAEDFFRSGDLCFTRTTPYSQSTPFTAGTHKSLVRTLRQMKHCPSWFVVAASPTQLGIFFLHSLRPTRPILTCHSEIKSQKGTFMRALEAYFFNWPGKPMFLRRCYALHQLPRCPQRQWGGVRLGMKSRWWHS